MTKLLDRLRNEFQGNADLLIAKAQELAKILRLDQEGSEGNERLLRHYVSMGVVDKPSREGRDALYGFRHLLQFVAARRLLAEGYALAKIAKYTAVVPTDALSDYLEKPGRASEAELLVAAFRSESPALTPSTTARRSAAPKPLPSVATGMGMVDVMHEMREMEQRVHRQLTDLKDRMHAMVDDALRDAGSRVQVQRIDPIELKAAVGKLADLMDDATQRFDRMLHKPLLMIEKQIEQQRYLFEEAHKQKEFLEHMFNDLLQRQRHELKDFFEHQIPLQENALHEQREFFSKVTDRLERLEAQTADKLYALERHTQALLTLPPSTPPKKEGAA
jgi:DNA-binding transcriptional MerR regulator